MKTKSIIACLFLMLATQVVSAQNEGERIIRAMVEKMKSHKNVEMVFNFSINPNDNDLGETEKSHAWLQGEAYKIERMIVYTYDSKWRVDGKKPKPYTYVVVSQKVRGLGNKLKFTRMEFDSGGNFTNLLAQPLDKNDIQ